MDLPPGWSHHRTTFICSVSRLRRGAPTPIRPGTKTIVGEWAAVSSCLVSAGTPVLIAPRRLGDSPLERLVLQHLGDQLTIGPDQEWRVEAPCCVVEFEGLRSAVAGYGLRTGGLAGH
jgi:hypothetical protein